MPDALGIHAHPTRKLGRRPPSNTRALQLTDHLLALPDTPLIDLPPNLSYPMDLNDKYGDCVVAGLDHTLQTIYTALTGSYVNWTDDQIIAYYKTQNSDFDPQTGQGDNGMDIQTFLSYLTKQGVILGFAKVDVHDEATMKAAIYLGLAIPTGEDLRVAQQAQPTWDYVAHSPDWGGHCTTTIAYLGTPDVESCVTWGEVVPMTQSFIKYQVEEAWFILTRAQVDHPEFRNHFDLSGFAQAWEQITGRTFPVPVPTPSPTPTPTPTPTPAAPPTVTDPAVVQRVTHVATREGLEPNAWLDRHLKHYFGITG
jgi:hypothetical protein